MLLFKTRGLYIWDTSSPKYWRITMISRARHGRERDIPDGKYHKVNRPLLALRK